jgi:epoxyqueuosine reductase
LTAGTANPEEIAHRIKRWARDLGFQQTGISDTDTGVAARRLHDWLARGRQGEMHYMDRHGSKRTQPQALLADTRSVVCVRMNYLPDAAPMDTVLHQPHLAYVSRYALGRDYHKLMRKRLTRLARQIETAWGSTLEQRAFVDSAPVLEKPLAERAGLGWIGKHTNLINRNAGSWFFLGELYTSLRLPTDTPEHSHCGRCRACLDVCPTGAIVAPYQLDARLCIAYLTIELQGSIPEPLRPLIGNRIFGCDDCQLICPWNRFAKRSDETDFSPRHTLDQARLTDLFSWDEAQFLQRTEGSAIRRIGHRNWLRNIAVALGNAPPSPQVVDCLRRHVDHPAELVREHVTWALDRQSENR